MDPRFNKTCCWLVAGIGFLLTDAIVSQPECMSVYASSCNLPMLNSADIGHIVSLVLSVGMLASFVAAFVCFLGAQKYSGEADVRPR